MYLTNYSVRLTHCETDPPDKIFEGMMASLCSTFGCGDTFCLTTLLKLAQYITTQNKSFIAKQSFIFELSM
jgi:hypothetical protein